MPNTPTPNLNLLKPALGDSGWNVPTNGNWDTIDKIFNSLPVVGTPNYPSIASAYAALPSTGGTVLVPPNWAETFTANLVLNKPNSGILFLGVATITMGTFQITSPSTAYNVFIRSLSAQGKFAPIAAIGTVFLYSGTGDAIAIGDGANDCNGTQIENISLVSTNSAQSGAGIRMVRTGQFMLKNLTIGGGNGVNQIGIVIDGASSGIGTDSGLSGGINLTTVRIGMQFINGAGPFTFRGFTWGGYAGAGSWIGIDVENSGGLQLLGIDINGTVTSGTAINFGGSSANNYINAYLNANIGPDITFGASTSRNKVVVQSNYAGGPGVTDTGANNSVEWLPLRLLNQQGATGTLTGNAADQAVYSFTVLPNTIYPGKGIRIRVRFLHTLGTASTAYKLKFGSTVLDTRTYAPTVANTQNEEMVYEIFNNAGVQNAQNYGFTGQIFQSGVATNAPIPLITNGTGAIDFTQQQVLTWTFNVANTDQLVGKFFLVESIQ